jgi:hypothetical protein
MLDPVEHYARLALMSGWIEYVRHQVKQLENHPTGMWIGLGKAIKRKMDELKCQL